MSSVIPQMKGMSRVILQVILIFTPQRELAGEISSSNLSPTPRPTQDTVPLHILCSHLFSFFYTEGIDGETCG
jgi:hypothetical protein